MIYPSASALMHDEKEDYQLENLLLWYIFSFTISQMIWFGAIYYGLVPIKLISVSTLG